MADENPYMNLLGNISDDEIFEIISDPSGTDNPQKYTAALSIALKREMISEYQVENLLDGNTTVLDYNPNNLSYQVEDFKLEKEIHKKESKKKLSNIHYGLMLIGSGILLLLLVYSDDLWFPTKSKIVAFVSIFVGIILLVIGFIEKRKNMKKEFS